MIDRLKVEVMIHLNIDLCVFIPIMCVWCVYLFDMYFDNSYIYIYIYLYTYYPQPDLPLKMDPARFRNLAPFFYGIH